MAPHCSGATDASPRAQVENEQAAGLIAVPPFAYVQQIFWVSFPLPLPVPVPLPFPFRLTITSPVTGKSSYVTEEGPGLKTAGEPLAPSPDWGCSWYPSASVPLSVAKMGKVCNGPAAVVEVEPTPLLLLTLLPLPESVGCAV